MLWRDQSINDAMAMTIESETRPTIADVLEDWLANALMHFPHAEVVSVLDYPNESECDRVFAAAGFHKISAFNFTRPVETGKKLTS
ncbi:hypothetical protein ASE94_17480 [Devosia sp. Leaf64]|nr:hypothetical protein ASE94_17480 [Devosia sp. Leaf64]